MTDAPCPASGRVRQIVHGGHASEIIEAEALGVFQASAHRHEVMWEGFKGYPMRKDYVVEDQDAPETISH